MANIVKILVALRLEYSSNQRFLAGIAKFTRRTSNWQVTIAEHFFDFTADSIRALQANPFDGIITVSPHNPNILQLLRQLNAPIAFIGSLGSNSILQNPKSLLIQSNNQLHGTKIAKHFHSLGVFRSYAFVATGVAVEWVDKRQDGFARELKNYDAVPITIRSPYPDGTPEDIDYLRQELLHLPKPTAVMGAYDRRAVHILQACNIANLKVPDLVQVIGVDNDPMLCDFTHPSLTSLAVNQIRMGEVTAIELNHLITTKSRRSARIILNDAEIIERDSTSPLSPSSHLIIRALSFIKENLTSELRPRDVVAYLKVSRALADKRFRELEGMSIGESITQQRLFRVRKKLRTTTHSIATISKSCGFANPDHANRLFKRKYGMTMREYRKSFVGHTGKTKERL